MKTNKIDKNIQQKLANRTFEPSASAWERLSLKLDEQPKQKKVSWFFYIGIAASILLLVSIGIELFSKKSEVIMPQDEVVINPIDSNSIDKKINDFVNERPVKEAIVKKEALEIKKKNKVEDVYPIKVKYQAKKLESKAIKKEGIAKVEKVEIDKKHNIENQNVKDFSIENSLKIEAQNPNSKIKVNADDLLYAVTHSPIEVKKYYAKYNVNREDILRTIKNELKKSKLKVNPETILAEVERTIDDDGFQNNFLKSLKSKVSDIASAIASRND